MGQVEREERSPCPLPGSSSGPPCGTLEFLAQAFREDSGKPCTPTHLSESSLKKRSPKSNPIHRGWVARSLANVFLFTGTQRLPEGGNLLGHSGQHGVVCTSQAPRLTHRLAFRARLPLAPRKPHSALCPPLSRRAQLSR